MGRGRVMPASQAQVTHLLAERAQLFRIDPVPDTLHIIPVGHNTVFHGILDPQQASEFLGLPANEDIALESASHDPSVLRSPDAVGFGKGNPVSVLGPGGVTRDQKRDWGRTKRGKNILDGPGQRIRP